MNHASLPNIDVRFMATKQEVAIDWLCVPGSRTMQRLLWEIAAVKRGSVDGCCQWCHLLLNPGGDNVESSAAPKAALMILWGWHRPMGAGCWIFKACLPDGSPDWTTIRLDAVDQSLLASVWLLIQTAAVFSCYQVCMSHWNIPVEFVDPDVTVCMVASRPFSEMLSFNYIH